MKYENCFETKPETFNKGDVFACDSYVRIFTKNGLIAVTIGSLNVQNFPAKEWPSAGMKTGGNTSYCYSIQDDCNFFVRKAPK